MILRAAIALLVVVAAAVPSAQARIVGGTDAPDHVYDAVANVSIAAVFGCTGTLIAPEWVLTAGHCGSVTGATGVGTPVGWPAGAVEVTLGTTAANGSGGETIVADQVIPSPEYLLTDGYDLALLHLQRPSAQVPVQVAGRGMEALWAPGVMQTIAGFGRIAEGGASPSVMQVAQVPIVADDTCRNAYPRSFESATQICAGYQAGGVDTCQGDSGGPLFGRDAGGVLKVTGATSYGAGCARPERYGVYARVADLTLREWIRGIVPAAIDDGAAVAGATSGATPPPGSGDGAAAPPPAAAPAQGAAPARLAATLAVPRASRRALAARGIRVRLGCDRACVAVLDLQADEGTARRAGLGSPRVGRVTVRLDGAGRVTRRIDSRRSTARRLARLRNARLSVVARVSGDGGGQTLSRRVTLVR
ncbi:MAG TPA: serine protease [Solirubrobacteraceae bacterium]|nr:serine protease [Solirubrobacteraceae bacterium]